MLSIKAKVKFKQQLERINNKKNKIMRYVLKPLFRLEDKIYTYKQIKIKEEVKSIDENLFIYLLVKNHIIKDLIKYPNDEIYFGYEYHYDEENILTYAKDLKNNILSSWCHKISFEEKQEVTNRLMELLKDKLKKYPEIEFYDYQRDKYYSKVLVIKLKE